MMHRLKLLLTVVALELVLLLSLSNSFASEPLEISKDFSMFTSENLKGFTKPLFTTFGESFNSNAFTKAVYPEHWTIGLDFSFMGMMIPSGQENYDAELPDEYGNVAVVRNAEIRNGVITREVSGRVSQPSIFGGRSNAVYAAPQNRYQPDSLYKSVAFADGNEITFMPGLPVIQLILGAPTRTQLRLRFLTFDIQGESSLYYGIMVNQQINHFVGLFGDDPDMGLAVQFGYSSFMRDPGLSMNSINFGAHYSKSWENGLSAYCGLQYEGLNGEFEAVREKTNPQDVANSPYSEVRNGEDLKFDIESFNSYRLLIGGSYKTGIAEFHADAALASQPVFSVGVSLYLVSFGKKESTRIERYERKEIIETKEVIE